MKPQNIHANHRQRMRQSFLKNGGSFYPHQLLEILLFYTIPRADTNPTAHHLIDKFSSLENIMNASVSELTTTEGIGSASACFINAVGELCRRYCDNSEITQNPCLTDSKSLKQYFIENFTSYKEDVLLIASVSTRLEIIHSEDISLRLFDNNAFSARHIAEIILRTGSERIAAGIFHPAQPAIPTERDYRLNGIIAETAKILGTELTDMIIFNRKSAFSMRETGAFSFSII